MSEFLLGALIACCLLILSWGLKRHSRMIQYPFLVAAVYLGWVVPQFLGLAQNPYLPPGALPKTLVMAILCLGAVYLGYTIRPRPARLFWWQFNERRLLIASLVLSLLGAFFFFQVSRLAAEVTAEHLWSGQEFYNLILKRGFGQATGVYTFKSAGLELLQAAKAQGLRTIMEQTIAPRRIEHQLLREEQQAFPDWEPPLPDDGFSEQFAEREQTEWGLADVILCGSEFVREGIAASGGPLARCAVVPYGVDIRFSRMERPLHEGPLRVLTVGAVGLRKGSPYVLEAAKRLQGKAEFRMVGSVQVLPKAESRLRSYVELTGPVPRTEILSHYAWADVLLLPSICEGSASVVYEALATGLPVICTPNTGSVVRDRLDGFIVPIRDIEAIAICIERLASDANLLAQMRMAAVESHQRVSLARYRSDLESVMAQLMNPRQSIAL